MEERKSRTRVGGLVVAPCQRGEGTYGTGVAARLAGAARQQWRREVVGARGGVGTADAREAVATTDVGRGGGGVLGVAGRVAWAQGERNRRRTHGRRWQWYIYATPLNSRCHPPTGCKGFFWRATKLQPTFTPGWAFHPGVKVGCGFVSRLF